MGDIDGRVREALTEMQMYLSDALAPLVVADSLELLLKYAPDLMAAGIHEWTITQSRSEGGTVPFSDYLYHALRKLSLIGEFKLVPKEELDQRIEDLKPIVLELCPPGDRETLRANLERLKDPQTGAAPPVSQLHRQMVSQAPLASQTRGVSAQDFTTSGRLSRLAQQLETVASATMTSLTASTMASATQPGAPAVTAAPPQAMTGTGQAGSVPPPVVPLVTAPAQQQGNLVTQILVVAAGNNQNPEDFKRARDFVLSRGSEASMEQVIRALGSNLPGYMVVPPEGQSQSGTVLPYRSGVAEALRKIVTVEEDPKEGAKRLHEMVRAAVEQLNEGQLGRAVTMFELAERIIAETKLDPVIVQQVRERAHESLDEGRLRKLAEDPDSQAPLRRVLSFFPALAPPDLLASLQGEERRDRRRLILALLEAHGTAARAESFERLKNSMGTFGDNDSYFQRNLLYLLRRIPKPADVPWEPELDLVCQLSEPGHPLPLVKEALANLGQIKHEDAERTLIARVGDFEAMLLKPTQAVYTPGDALSLLDRAIYALARYGTVGALRAVVNHGLKRQSHLGDTTARLAELSGQDLSFDEESVARLVKALESELPRKVFGFVIERGKPRAKGLIAALSATPTSAVRAALEDVVERFPDEDFGRSAAQVLRSFKTAPRSTEKAVKSLSGDLDLFGLPTLLQNLAQSQAGGLLTLKDRHEQVVGTIILEEGRMLGARVGPLRGEHAVYQLLERPTGGNFVFVSPYDVSTDTAVRPGVTAEVVPLLFEGIRRYDEYQQACALIPDDVTLQPTGSKPTRLADEADKTFLNALWSKVTAGATPIQCEESLPVDAYRVRRMIAHWVEGGALTLS
ncbi:MAG: DUF4388 domain-containing protein [Acidobacteriota bacterium]